MDLQVGIIQVAVRTTNNGRQIFDVSCSDGETRAVWDAGLANAINAFAGSGAVITIREKVSQRGQYTNRSITAFAPPGQALPPDNGQGGGGPGGQGGGGFKRGGGMTPEDKTRISKMAAQSVAYGFVGQLLAGAGPEALAEGVQLAEGLVKQLYVAARSHEKKGGDEQQGVTVLQPGAAVAEQPQAQGQVLQPGATAAQVAAVVPGVQVGTQALQPGGAADATAAADVQLQQAAEAGDGIEWD